MSEELAVIDEALDEILVQLGGMVLTLAKPEITKSCDEQDALMRSVNQFAKCAAVSPNPRVLQLKTQLEEKVRPQLRLIVDR